MSIIDFSKRDILRSTIVDPGYYLVQIQKVSESISKKGNSTNYVIDEAEIICDESGGTKFAGVPVPYWGFNSLAKGFMIPFFEAIEGEKIEDGSRMQWSNALEGKKVYVMIDNEMFEGRPVNKQKHMYKPARQE